MIADLGSFCKESWQFMQFIGYVLLIFRIAIPIVIIVYGAIDFGKAVVAEKDDEIKAKAKRLLWRAIAGICIFFIPSFVLWAFTLVSDFNTNSDEVGFSRCSACIKSPTSSSCSSGR